MTVLEAQGAIDALNEKKARLVGLLAETAHKLAETEARAGDAFLDGNEAVMRDARDLRLKFDTLNSALQALERRYEPARINVQRAILLENRQEAARKGAELDKLNEQTGRLLEKLSSLEDVNFTHSILSSQPIAEAWYDPEKINGDLLE